MLASYHSGSIWGSGCEHEYVSTAAWGGMLHVGCECWDGASVSLTALKCLCTVFPLLSSLQPTTHLPLFPPPINDPFVRVFLPRWAGVPQKGQAKTRGLSWKCFLSTSFFVRSLYFSFCVFLLFRYFLSCFMHFSRSSFSSSLMNFSNSSSPMCPQLPYCCSAVFFFPPKAFVVCLPFFPHLFSHCVSPHSQVISETFKNRFCSGKSPCCRGQAEKNTLMQTKSKKLYDNLSIIRKNRVWNQLIILSLLIMAAPIWCNYRDFFPGRLWLV